MASPDADSIKKHSELNAARAEKDYDHSLKLLDEILSLTPDALEAMITQAHLRALKGAMGLADYRDTISGIMTRLQNTPVPSIAVGRKVLRGIQYSCTGALQTQFLGALLLSNKHAIERSSENALDHLVLQANIYLAQKDYERFIQAADELTHPDKSPKKIRQIKKIARRLKSRDFPDHAAEKIFGIGLSRTATSSLNQALVKLGYESIHWLNPNTQTVIAEQDFFLFDGFTDIPATYQFEELFTTFPNSRFIYTTRSRDSWINSVTAHYKNARGITSPAELLQPDIAERFNGAALPAESNLYSQYETWDEAYDNFQRRISRFFSNEKRERFLELRITEGEGWEKLCAFLDKDIPSAPFPNVNKRPSQSTAKESV